MCALKIPETSELFPHGSRRGDRVAKRLCCEEYIRWSVSIYTSQSRMDELAVSGSLVIPDNVLSAGCIYIKKEKNAKHETGLVNNQ